MSLAEQKADELRAIMSQSEGSGIDDAMYAFSTKTPSDDTVVEGSWADVLSAFHRAKVDDQFVPPIVAVDAERRPISTVRDNDWLIYTDYRTDRAKPLTAAFLDTPHGGQQGGLSDQAEKRLGVQMVTMTHYDDNFTGHARLHEAFNPAEPLTDTYAEVLGRAGVSQLVVAESEKWRAVTWFKDGRRNLGYEKVDDNMSDELRAALGDAPLFAEDHPQLPVSVRIVESRKVSAHIEAPQMRAAEIGALLRDGVRRGVPDIFANFANADMVAHAMTDGDRFDDVVKGLLALDEALEPLVKEALEAGYVVFVTGDHGNGEEMFVGDSKKPKPSHTNNKVPFVVLGLSEEECNGLSLKEDLTIGDIGPAALQLRGLEKPEAWDRESPFVGGAIKADPKRRVMRLVLDGYGCRDEEYGNAMLQAAKTREGQRLLCVERWMKGEDGAVFAQAEASGEECGYPEGQAGTTEFGHVLFDAGRTVRSDLTLIDHAIKTGAFGKNPAFVAAADAVLNAIKEGKTGDDVPIVHITGVLSDGRVHGSLDHLDALLALLAAKKVPADRVHVHAITDGRDVAGDSSPKYVAWLMEAFKRHGVGQLVSASGRGFAKDRNSAWKRIELGYRSYAEGTAAIHLQVKN